MIAFEIALLIFFAVIIVSALMFLAKPLTEVFSERLKYRYRELGSEGETLLRTKLYSLEEEVVAMKQQLTCLQETVEYLGRDLEAQQQKLKLTDKQPQ